MQPATHERTRRREEPGLAVRRTGRLADADCVCCRGADRVHRRRCLRNVFVRRPCSDECRLRTAGRAPHHAVAGGSDPRRRGRDGWRPDCRSLAGSRTARRFDRACVRLRLSPRAHHAGRTGARRTDRRHQRSLAGHGTAGTTGIVRPAGGVYRTRPARAGRGVDRRSADHLVHATAVRRGDGEGGRACRPLRRRDLTDRVRRRSTRRRSTRRMATASATRFSSVSGS